MFSRAERRGYTPNSAVTTPTRRRTSSGALRVSKPSTSTEPASGASSVQMTRSVVVLPAPLGPSRPKISPGRASRLTPRRTWFEPRDFSRRSILTAGPRGPREVTASASDFVGDRSLVSGRVPRCRRPRFGRRLRFGGCFRLGSGFCRRGRLRLRGSALRLRLLLDRGHRLDDRRLFFGRLRRGGHADRARKRAVAGLAGDDRAHELAKLVILAAQVARPLAEVAVADLGGDGDVPWALVHAAD